jgi:hypothetical protein
MTDSNLNNILKPDYNLSETKEQADQRIRIEKANRDALLSSGTKDKINNAYKSNPEKTAGKVNKVLFSWFFGAPVSKEEAYRAKMNKELSQRTKKAATVETSKAYSKEELTLYNGKMMTASEIEAAIAKEESKSSKDTKSSGNGEWYLDNDGKMKQR